VVTVRLLGELYQSTRGAPCTVGAPVPDDEWCSLEGGSFPLGCSDDPDGWDNERPAHLVEVPSFRLQRYPVSERAWLEMMQAGGYADRSLWSAEGWAFRCAHALDAPLHWRPDRHGCYWKRTLGGPAPVGGGCPVAHVSFHEAEAFARFWGARLPSEEEWEYAAGWDPALRRKRRFPWGDVVQWGAADLDLSGPGPAALGRHRAGASAFGVEDLCGGVWEWVGSQFEPYPGFSAGAYAAYSAPWFGAKHRVARGGSFATAPENARVTFRNWYAPHQREPCLGVRLAQAFG
jgi:iron(II)-dependent oxidoreductase